MRKCDIRLAAAAGFVSCVAGLAGAGSPCPTSDGPDAIIDEIQSVSRWDELDGVIAYSAGVVTCNVGAQRVDWNILTPQHPVITMNLYRLKDGRIEQIGMSWARHMFVALSGAACCTCVDPTDGSELGVGCSTTDSANIMGGHNYLSPRSSIDASLGIVGTPQFTGQPLSNIDRRLQVRRADLDPALNADAIYFIEMQIVAADDHAAGNALNNVSHRQVTAEVAGEDIDLFVTGPTFAGAAGVCAWVAVDPQVHVSTVESPGDGLCVVASKATPLLNGRWLYDYAVQNLNSHRSVRAFTIASAAGGDVTSPGFHDVEYHSGDPYDGADWAFSFDSGGAAWSTSTFGENPDANAIRWGTMYNFWFESDAPPAAMPGAAQMSMFRPGGPDIVDAPVIVPADTCPADVDGDGVVGAGDLALLLGGWGSPGAADLNGDGTVASGDLALMLGAWGGC